MDKWEYSSPGIPDHLFVRSEGIPMTKQEVRAVVLSKLCPAAGSTVIDIGSGTGAVSVECAFMGCAEIYSVDYKKEAVEILQKNIENFYINNIVPVYGSAPGVLEDLPYADRVFVGGTGGSLKAVLEKVYEKMKPGGRVVVNSVTMETGPEAVNFFNKYGFLHVEAVSINIARAAPRGGVYMWQPLSPVQIISAQKRGD